MKLNDKHGIALIDLLITIIIIATISIIATSIVMNPTSDEEGMENHINIEKGVPGAIDYSKKEALFNSAHGLVKAAEKECLFKSMDGSISTETVIYDFGKETHNNLDFRGEMPRGGIMKVNDNCAVSLSIYNDNWCALKSFDETEIIVVELDENCNQHDRP